MIKPYLEINRESNPLHPTPKPIALMKYLIETYTQKQKIILDFAMGSGTTYVTVKNLNRKSIRIEINPAYCDMAVKRLRQEIFDFR